MISSPRFSNLINSPSAPFEGLYIISVILRLLIIFNSSSRLTSLEYPGVGNENDPTIRLPSVILP